MAFFRRTTIDHLYRWLGVFTALYLILISFEFFLNLHLRYPTLERLLDALAEPYLGALAVYTVLKEVRKRREGRSRGYRGEWYVAAWLVLLAVTTAAVMFTARYQFDVVFGLILGNSLASLMIYLGSRLHRP